MLLGRHLAEERLGYDDLLDAFGVHGIGGIVGAILTGVFAVEAIGGEGKKGLIDGNPGQVLTSSGAAWSASSGAPSPPSSSSKSSTP